jgi:transcription initiation factor TFIIIB Brf1 subunit/transcription initiation factor TFIIB
LDDKKLDKPTEAGDSTYSQALVPEVIDVNEVKITNKLNDLLTHQKVDVPFHID